MNSDVFVFFDKMPEAYPLYKAVEDKICEEFAEVKIKVQKTQISFSNKYNFAFVSLSGKRVILTFGLGRQVVHPKIAVSTEPYPRRWTHHVFIQTTEDVDEQVMEWIKEAYGFSMTK